MYTNPTYAQAVAVANNLVTEEGDTNIEYDRALVELLHDLYTPDCPVGLIREHVAADLGLELEVLYP